MFKFTKLYLNNTHPRPLLLHPSLKGRFTPGVNEQESRRPPVLFDTNADKMALAFKDLYGQFLRYRVHFPWHSKIPPNYMVCILWKCSIAVINVFSGPTMCTDLRSNLCTMYFNILKMPFWPKNALIWVQNIPKEADLQHLGGLVSTMFSWESQDLWFWWF